MEEVEGLLGEVGIAVVVDEGVEDGGFEVEVAGAGE